MRYFLTKDTTTIGRASECDICLPDPSISRTHVVIKKQSERYLITDQSTNGTFFQGQRITSRILEPNDTLKIGAWSVHFMASEETAPEEDEKTQIIRRDPTRILSFNPDRGELVFERAILEIQSPKNEKIPITSPLFSIGKGENNDLILADDFVSTFHCKIEFKKGKYFLKDVGSTNGTLLNGKKVVESELPFDSVLQIGKTPLRFISAEEVKKVKPYRGNQFEGIVSNSSSMQSIFSLIERVANANTTILIQGETGTGKELIAGAIHRRSSRARRPFVALNCGAISKDLIESELFGHEKGAFTSAHQQRKGVFEQANGGTLFLDEIGELPLDLQPKLLRVLETSEIKRVGGTQTIDVDVRVVAATHRNLAELVKQGKFREDLFYRLYVVPIDIPPLRKRSEDIPLLVAHFLEQEFIREGSKTTKKLDPDAMRSLTDYEWPGNIRELKNVISRAFLHCQTDTIGAGDLQFAPSNLRKDTDFQFDDKAMRTTSTRSLKDIEREKIVTELRKNNWNKKETAQVLGIAKSTLHEKIKKYRIKEGES